MSLSLADIVSSVASGSVAQLLGDPDIRIERLSGLDAASPNDLSFLSHPKYLRKLETSAAACVVVSPIAQDLPHDGAPALLSMIPIITLRW